MQLSNTNNATSFGRLGFVNKATKEAFFRTLNDTNSFCCEPKGLDEIQQILARHMVAVETNRHDRLLRIGMSNIKGNRVFTCEGIPLVADKRGKQPFFAFMLALFTITNKRVLKKMQEHIASKIGS